MALFWPRLTGCTDFNMDSHSWDPVASAERGVRYIPNRLRDRIHRILFGTVAALGPQLQSCFLQVFFEMKYRRPNPWCYEATPYQQQKSGSVLTLLPKSCYWRALEIGCGEGGFSRKLLTERRAIELFGIDISERAIVRARARCADWPGAHFEAGDILRMPIKGSFDLVIVCELLYYLGDAAATLGKLTARLLAPGGCVVLVHPWPDARALHAGFAHAAGLLDLHEHIESNSERPFCVTLLGQ